MGSSFSTPVADVTDLANALDILSIVWRNIYAPDETEASYSIQYNL